MRRPRKEVVEDTVSGQAAVLSEIVATMLQPVLDEYGIGFGTFDLLAAVHSAEGKIPQAAIARRMGISAASLTEAVKSGVKRGLVTQSDREGDLRAKVLVLSKDGEAVLHKCFGRLEQIEGEVLKGVSAQDKEVALQVLQSGVNNLLSKSK